MEWLDNNDAPPDVRVKLGRYETNSYAQDTPLQWKIDIGIARETKRGFFGQKYVQKTFDGNRYTHYKLLPTPPGDANA